MWGFSIASDDRTLLCLAVNVTKHGISNFGRNNFKFSKTVAYITYIVFQCSISQGYVTLNRGHQANPHVHQQHIVFVLFLPFDLIKAGATQTETSLLKQYVADERVDLPDMIMISRQEPSLPEI